MSRTYRTIDGDVLDAICKRELGSESHVPAVLEANPRLAKLGVVYDAGLIITLPEVTETLERGRVRLWGRT
jgi:phage tail protein X